MSVDEVQWVKRSQFRRALIIVSTVWLLIGVNVGGLLISYRRNEQCTQKLIEQSKAFSDDLEDLSKLIHLTPEESNDLVNRQGSPNHMKIEPGKITLDKEQYATFDGKIWVPKGASVKLNPDGGFTIKAEDAK